MVRLKLGERKVPGWKKEKVAELKELLSYPTVAIIDLQGLPAKQLQFIRRKLKDKIIIKITKKILIKKALQELGQERFKKLAESLCENPGLLLSKLDPFELFKVLKKNQSSAPIKAGQIAPEDIWVRAGPTPFTPGPIISEFGKLGIKTAVEGGKITIKADTLVLKKGDVASETAASILTKLGIEPMKIGVKIVNALEGEQIYPAEILDINIEDYIEQIKEIYTNALKLAFSCAILNSDTVELLLQKAHREALALAVTQRILTKETVGLILARASAQAYALQARIKG